VAAIHSLSAKAGELAARHGVPLVGAGREFVMAGALFGYSADIVDAYRLTGGYAARVLKGEKPSDLPVQQAIKIELLINLKVAKALGVTVPRSILARTDKAIE